MDLKVKRVENEVIKEWILNKHYAKRRCSTSFAFGLFIDNVLVGVCSYGYPPNYNYNNGKCLFKTHNVLTLELNRLVVNDGLEKNVLSRFVSKTLDLLPKPSCVVSYSDPNNGHHGYIYQATNWLYTGESTPKFRYVFADGYEFDIRRGLDKKIIEHGEVVEKKRLKPTLRYIYINASKLQKRRMIKDLKVTLKEYPKGKNFNYDCSYMCKEIKI